MKYGFFCILTLGLIFGAYQTAQNKIRRPLEFSALRLGMTVKELERAFGTPSAKSHNQIIYVMDDGSQLSVTFRDKIVSSANVKFHHPIHISEPKMRALTLIQMDAQTESNRPSWFYAGNPAEGLIYKITASGEIEGQTWVPPFTYGNAQPKHLQALLRDFRGQQVSNL